VIKGENKVTDRTTQFLTPIGSIWHPSDRGLNCRRDDNCLYGGGEYRRQIWKALQENFWGPWLMGTFGESFIYRNNQRGTPLPLNPCLEEVVKRSETCTRLTRTHNKYSGRKLVVLPLEDPKASSYTQERPHETAIVVRSSSELRPSQPEASITERVGKWHDVILGMYMEYAYGGWRLAPWPRLVSARPHRLDAGEEVDIYHQWLRIETENIRSEARSTTALG